MKRSEIIKFISENEGCKLEDFYNKNCGKLRSLNNRIEILIFSIILTLFVYFALAKAESISLPMGSIILKGVRIILPVLFSYLVFDLMLASTSKTNVYIALKLTLMALQKQNTQIKDFRNASGSLLAYVIFPFPYTIILSRMLSKKACTAGLIIRAFILLPLIALYIMPVYFEYYILKDTYNLFFSDLPGKIAFCSALLLAGGSVFYYISLAVSNYYDYRDEKNNGNSG